MCTLTLLFLRTFSARSSNLYTLHPLFSLNAHVSIPIQNTLSTTLVRASTDAVLHVIGGSIKMFCPDTGSAS